MQIHLFLAMILTAGKLQAYGAYKLCPLRSNLRKSGGVLYSSHRFPDVPERNQNISPKNCIKDQFSRQQASYLSEMTTWKGVSASSSEFVTHFVAGSKNVTNIVQNEKRQFELTVEEAVLSILPRTLSSHRFGPKGKKYSQDAWKEWLLQQENSSVVQACEPRFRHDPSLFPLEISQLSPVDLVALGAVWFLPAAAPKDPSLGTKV